MKGSILGSRALRVACACALALGIAPAAAWGAASEEQPASDEEALQEAAKAHDLMVTLEDNVLTGGAGEEIDALLINENTRVLNMGWPDTFIEHGSCDQLYRVHGLDAAAIAERIKKELEG